MDQINNTINDKALITEEKFNITSVCEGGGEYTMPDYYPPVRKIVSYNALALPDTKFLSGDTLEYGGTLAFNVLYIGEDGALVSLPYTCEYSGKAQLPKEVKGTGEVMLDAAAEDIQCRATAPRKISLRARIRSVLSAFETKNYSVDITDGEGNGSHADRRSIQNLMETVPVMTVGSGSHAGSVSGKIEGKEGAKPVSCTGHIGINEVKCKKDSVFVRGDAVIRCLIFTKEGIYSSFSSKLPFEEIISAEGCREGDLCTAWGRAASVTVAETESGGFTADIEYDLDFIRHRPGELQITTDAYSTDWQCTLETKENHCLSSVCCANASLSLSGNGKRTTKPSQGEYLIDMTCEPSPLKAEEKDNKVIFTGNCKIRSYIASDGEVICEEMTLPVKYEASSRSLDGDGDLLVTSHISTTDINGRLDGDTVFANAELCLSICCKKKTKICPVSKILLDKSSPIPKSGDEIKVFYPHEGEKIWNIAKKYLCDARRLEKSNGISINDASSGKPVLIPN